MKSFERFKTYLCRMGLLPRNSSPDQPLQGIGANCVIFGLCAVYLLTTSWFFLFTAQTFNEYTQSFFFVSTSVLLLSWYSICFWHKQRHAAFFAEIDRIIGERIENPLLHKTYQKLVNRIEILTKVFQVAILQFILPANIVIYVGASFFQYISSGFSNESFQQIFPAAIPFDWKSPFGYLACSLIQAVLFLNAAVIFSNVIILAIGFCTFASGFALDLKESLRPIQQDLISMENNVEQKINIKMKLVQFIQFHSEARQFTNCFSQSIGSMVFVYLVFVIVSFGSMSLQVIMSIRALNIPGILQSLSAMNSITIALYLFCHFGDQVTQRFEDVSEAVYQLSWYSLPLELQKHLPTVIAMSQKRVFVRGFADTRSTREVFRKNLKNKFIFFIVARKF